MSRRVRTFVPIRSFAGMTRLEPALGPDERRHLAIDCARRTAQVATEAGTDVTVVTNDAEVRRWTRNLDMRWIAEPEPGNLNTAAAAAVAAAAGTPWMVIHADLPTVTIDDVRTAALMATVGTVLCPSHDGGTSVIGGLRRSFPFRYGPGSFGRHFAAVRGRAAILIRPGLSCDLDSPRDLNAFQRLGYLSSGPSPAPGLGVTSSR